MKVVTAALVLAALPAAADTYARQPVDVLHYDVSLSFVPALAYEGRARLDVRLLAEGLAELRLDFDGPHLPVEADPEGWLLATITIRPR